MQEDINYIDIPSILENGDAIEDIDKADGQYKVFFSSEQAERNFFGALRSRYGTRRDDVLVKWVDVHNDRWELTYKEAFEYFML